MAGKAWRARMEGRDLERKTGGFIEGEEIKGGSWKGIKKGEEIEGGSWKGKK